MIIRINGQNETLANLSTLEELMTARQLAADALVVEYNERIIPKSEWAAIRLSDNDRLEIISFVGGG